MSKIEHIEDSLLDEFDELGKVAQVDLAPAKTELLPQIT